MNTIDIFETSINEAITAIQSLSSMKEEFSTAYEIIKDTLLNGNKLLSIGNGGSAAEAMHIAEELSGRFKKNRKALPGLALCADGTAMTCICNDYGADNIFSRQVEAFGKSGDVLVIFSTSGNSINLIKAAEVARANNIKIISLLGKDGGKLKGMSDVEMIIPSKESAHIQEAHQVILHALLEKLDTIFE